jgi:hypothetical protein
MRRNAIAALPCLIFLLFYTATIALGSLYFLSDEGSRQLWNFLGGKNDNAAKAIGSLPYLVLTFGPYVVTPLFAWLGFIVFRRLLPRDFNFKPRSPGWAIWLLTIGAIAFCIYRLSLFDALVPKVGTYQQNILSRMFVYERVGLGYFVCAYAVLPISAVMFMCRAALERKTADLIGLIVTILAFDYFILAIYTKSHFLVFAIMLASGVIFARMKLYWVPIVFVLAFATFIPAELALSGVATQSNISVQRDDLAVKPAPPTDRIAYLKYFVTHAMAFRMASALPFYVSVFQDSKERCGIEAHTLRRLLHLPDSDCVLPIKIFSTMYPEVHWVTGDAPAAAPISAYGELGLTWSIIVMAMSGLILGILGCFATLGEGPVFVAIGAAACTFGYYLTQLPFIAGFTYPHGLIFFSIPIAFVFVAGLLTSHAKP